MIIFFNIVIICAEMHDNYLIEMAISAHSVCG